MFPSLKRTSQTHRQAGIGVAATGISVASVSRLQDQLPQLEACAFRSADGAKPAKLLSELVKEYGLSSIPSLGVMEAGAYSLLLVETPSVPATEVKAAIRWRIRDLIDFPVEEAVIDIFDIPGQKALGRPGTTYVVVARSAVIQERTELLEGAGLNLTVLDIPELALRNIAALLPQDARGVAMLYLTPRGGYITLTRRGTLYLARNIEIGTEQLAAAQNDPNGFNSALLDSIILEIQRSLDYYESHYSQTPIMHLVIAPGEYDMPEESAYIADKLGITVMPLDLNTLLICKLPLSTHLQALCLTAIGTALRLEEKAA